MSRPVALCHVHRLEVAAAVVPEILREQLAAALQGGATAPAVRHDLIASAASADISVLLKGVHDSAVYFVANGGRVKIGYTTNLRSRLGSLALRGDSVLLALHGGPELERALHARFAQYRDGTTEWFELAPAVFRFIAAPHPSRNAVAPKAEHATPGPQRAPRGATDLLARARELQQRALQQTGNPVSVRRLKRELCVGQPKAERLRALLDAEHERAVTAGRQEATS